MLREMRNIRREAGAGTRRWFRDPYFDLIVWCDEQGDLIGFRLGYDRQGRERAFTWRKDWGPWADGELPSYKVAERFLQESAQIDPELEFGHVL